VRKQESEVTALGAAIGAGIQAGMWTALRATGYGVFHYSDNVVGILIAAGILLSALNGRWRRIIDFAKAFRGLFLSEGKNDSNR
jgi:hypothetical protein